MDRSHRSAARSTSSRRLGRRPSVAFADVGSSLTAKAGTLFIVCGADGDIDLDRNPGHGLYLDDMRFLDRAVLRLDGQPLGVLLSQSQGDRLISELANADIQLRSAGPLSKDRVSVARERQEAAAKDEVEDPELLAGRVHQRSAAEVGDGDAVRDRLELDRIDALEKGMREHPRSSRRLVRAGLSTVRTGSAGDTSRTSFPDETQPHVLILVGAPCRYNALVVG